MQTLADLLPKAFDSAPAMEANQAIARARDTHGVAGQPAVSYEAVVPADATLGHLAEHLLPKLVYFLDCRGGSLTHTPGVFVSLFVSDRLYFFDAAVVVEAARTATQLSLDDLLARWGADATPPH